MITSEDKDKKVRFQNWKRWPKLVLARHPKTKSNFRKTLLGPLGPNVLPKKVSFRGQLKPTRSSGLSSCIISKLADCSIMCVLQQILQHLAEKDKPHDKHPQNIVHCCGQNNLSVCVWWARGKKSRTTHRTWWWWWCKNGGEERDAGFMRKTVAKRELQHQLNVTFRKGAGM